MVATQQYRREPLLRFGTALGFAVAAIFSANAMAEEACPDLLDVEVRPLASDDTVRLCEVHRGEVLLVVNTASQCGFTRQYEGLEALDAELRDRGFRVVGFPSGDFGNQEYADEEQIAKFCRSNYSIQFPMYEKMHAAEGQVEPGSLYQRLGTAAGEYPRWNFHKYLIDRDGQMLGSYHSRVVPNDRNLRAAIEAAL